MRQIKRWLRANGGPPAVVVAGFGGLALSHVLGFVLIGVGVAWFVIWLEPVRDLLIAFLEYPDQWADEAEGTSGVDKTHVHAEPGSTVNVLHIHPEGRRRSRRRRRRS